ncbi:hypothetical protein COW36_01850 [bacterium (Candidatus Blackallbacteria) CG17_big_fil_post_rev_8_21_14_2_50_48_46]|uniref:Uncharacterized protein n=1 Tax=bacterium (Candidatus Blackallbacteria) CG17_big_fil_post_rev_8_21_14_2_50_48_46 TaxID=2014261 RepID=A0A2M7GAK4_9BACT|nr:MAG: hypothetical protein COW64_26240 [bacterium (Candidatus Blackallbacteria) CG18_big_fil_WC_8_21_14_2_50_49_26]PIW19180.1 MAG: hypothetical protein COW36_01850 [bacterium (Candidatus Blackallbacteria) CG17_big_fil_post_rev_8_21_14_2_50_48_46]PIW45470.1 MAG: hypothetical protein COW20_20290 [bacterium (Candidatus Blackallbacteria) CG13_big_fil_rev_8_21_14_2_50_49_14]
MAHPNFLTPLHHELLSPLVGKIATGFKFEQTPDPRFFSDKFTVRMRMLDRTDSQLLLGIHSKPIKKSGAIEAALNIGVNLLISESADPRESILGFDALEESELEDLLRQPLNSVYLLKNQSLVLRFAHEAIKFEAICDSEGMMGLHWQVYI